MEEIHKHFINIYEVFDKFLNKIKWLWKFNNIFYFWRKKFNNIKEKFTKFGCLKLGALKLLRYDNYSWFKVLLSSNLYLFEHSLEIFNSILSPNIHSILSPNIHSLLDFTYERAYQQLKKTLQILPKPAF